MAGRLSEASRLAKSLPADKGVRERLGEALAEEYELLLQMLRSGAAAKKKIRVGESPCRKCGCQHIRFVEIDDTATALKVAEFWANQGLGRPGEDRQTVGAPSFVVHRSVVDPGSVENGA